MSAFPYLVLLFCLVGLGVHVSESLPSPTANPECVGMNRVARSLEKGLKTYTSETTICRVNNACTGLMCNGTHKQNDFYMRMELKHCNTPSIHLDLVYKKIKVHREMTNGRIKISSKKTPLGIAIPIDLKLTLKRDRNRITTGLEIQLCPLKCQTIFTLLRRTTFCLNMKTCPGYNSTGDVPCNIDPTGDPMAITTHSSVKTACQKKAEEAMKQPPIGRYVPQCKPDGSFQEEQCWASTGQCWCVNSDGNEILGTISRSNKLNCTGSGIGDTHAQKRGSGHYISAGVAVGIAFACLVGVLIIVGAAFYWKKFYRRTRLRAAYYNDISMNDPLYEDFGPEVA